MFQIDRILNIEDDDGPDISFLRVRPIEGQKLASAIPLSATAAREDEMVAVIGYPARDSRIPEAELMASIFGDVFDKKRLAPGQITRKQGAAVLDDGRRGAPIHGFRTTRRCPGAATAMRPSSRAVT